jgi:hypothetical protein
LGLSACAGTSTSAPANTSGGSDTATAADASPGTDAAASSDAATTADTTGSSGTPNVQPAKAGLSTKDFDSSKLKTKKEKFDLYVGAHPVVIYATKAPNVAKLGGGTLELARDGSMASMALKTATGDTTASLKANIDVPDNGIVNLQIFGMVSVAQDDHPARGMDARFHAGEIGPKGLIEGMLGLEGPTGTGDLLYFFRNNIEYVAAKTPDALAKLAGTYKGPRVSMMGGQPDVTVIITADGEVKVQGKSSLTQVDTTITVKWDGNDDFIAPIYEQKLVGSKMEWVATGNYEIALDSLNSGGSRPGGGVRIVVPALDTLAAKPVLLSVKSNLGGAEGALEVNDPKKQ